MKSKKSNFEKVRPASISVFYHHFYDVSVIRVTLTFEDGSQSVYSAKTTSSNYHNVEKRAYFCDAKRTIEHLIYNCKYENIY